MILPEYRAWIRTLPCTVSGCPGRSVAAHLPRVKRHGDEANMLPLCVAHHAEQHTIGVKSFGRKYDLDLAALAMQRWGEYAEDFA